MLSQKIIKWYHQNRRDLPWRNTTNPYFIWLSEVILQQTRVNQGLPYYDAFISQFPDVKSLAEATEEQILRTWQGLGYYSRARNLHKTAKYIHENLSGIFPDNYQDLIRLPGIGPYTAAAISSFAFSEKRAVVDGNVYRVLSRLYEIELPINSSKGAKYFSELANGLIPEHSPGDFNQGIMELGATVCLPKNPACEQCPLMLECAARKNQTIDKFPVKQGKQKVRTRYFNYLIIKYQNKVYLQKRDQKDIWQGLYEFYLIETQTKQETPEEFDDLMKPFSDGSGSTLSKISSDVHILSHQRIEATFWLMEIEKIPLHLKESFFNRQEIEQLPKSRLVDKFLLKYHKLNITLTDKQ